MTYGDSLRKDTREYQDPKILTISPAALDGYVLRAVEAVMGEAMWANGLLLRT